MLNLTTLPLLAGRGIGGIVSWFIRVVIYDICVTTIQEVFGVGRFTALMIFLGILFGISFVSYMLRRRMSRPVDSDL
ncbi:MAG: hypothetical protein EXS13_14830 [Planctomycetes bacterium]|nr:hypothetical protein [Planctomycetota bacterium]